MATRKFAIAKQLGGKRIITNKGEEIGRLSDIMIDEGSGKIESLLIEANSDCKMARDLAKFEGLGVIPYKSVFAVSDVIVVDETMLV